MRRHMISWAGLLLCLRVSTPFHEAVPSGALVQKELFQYDISVTLKLIQVYVTDKSGQPVRDLTKEDFAVFDEGKPVTVTEFEKHEFLQPESRGEEQPVTEPVAPVAVPSPGLNRKYFLFFDFAYNDQRGAAASLKVAGRFLDNEVLPEDEVAIVSYSALKGLTVHEYLTQDHAKVRRALADLSAKEIAGRAEEIEQLYSMATQEDLTPAARYNLNWQRQEAKSLARNYFSALTALAKAMRLIEGQKHFLFFSTGTPYSLIHGSEPTPAEVGKQTTVGRRGSTIEMGDTILRPLSEGMFKEFSASNCSIFSFDTRGAAKVPSLFAYEDMRNVTGGGAAFSGAGVSQSQTDLFRDDKNTGQDSLRRLAKETGGRYFSNIVLYERNLDAVRNMTGTYYVLGYSISAPKDGEFHKLKVEVKRKGCRVQTQAGYFNPKPFKEYTDLEKQIQLFDLALNEHSEGRTQKEFGVTALTYDAGGGPRLRLLSRIPREIVQFFKGKSLEFVSLAFDDQGNPVSLGRKTADLAGFKDKEIVLTSGTAPQPGRYRCRIVIRDLETGDSAVASTEVNVAKIAAAGLALCTPLLLVPAEAPVCLEANEKKLIDFPSWLDVYPHDQEGLAPAAGEIPRTAGRAVVVVPFSATGPERLNVVFSAHLISMTDGQGVPVPFSELERSRAGTLDVASFEFPLEQVPPGKYWLYIYATDKDSGAQAQTHLPLVVSSPL